MQRRGAEAALLELQCLGEAAGPPEKWRIWKEAQEEMRLKRSSTSMQSSALKLTPQQVDSICAVSAYLSSLPSGTRVPQEGLLEAVLEFLESAPQCGLDPFVAPLLSSSPLGQRPLAAAAAAVGAALASPELSEEQRSRLVSALRSAISRLAQSVPESVHETDATSSGAQSSPQALGTAPVAVALLGDLAACCPPLGSATSQPEDCLPALNALQTHTIMSPEEIAASASSGASERRITADGAGTETPVPNGSATPAESGSPDARQLAREEAQAASLVLAAKLLEGYAWDGVPQGPTEAAALRKPVRALLERAQTVLQAPAESLQSSDAGTKRSLLLAATAKLCTAAAAAQLLPRLPRGTTKGTDRGAAREGEGEDVSLCLSLAQLCLQSSLRKLPGCHQLLESLLGAAQEIFAQTDPSSQPPTPDSAHSPRPLRPTASEPAARLLSMSSSSSRSGGPRVSVDSLLLQLRSMLLTASLVNTAPVQPQDLAAPWPVPTPFAIVLRVSKAALGSASRRQRTAFLTLLITTAQQPAPPGTQPLVAGDSQQVLLLVASTELALCAGDQASCGLLMSALLRHAEHVRGRTAEHTNYGKVLLLLGSLGSKSPAVASSALSSLLGEYLALTKALVGHTSLANATPILNMQGLSRALELLLLKSTQQWGQGKGQASGSEYLLQLMAAVEEAALLAEALPDKWGSEVVGALLPSISIAASASLPLAWNQGRSLSGVHPQLTWEAADVERGLVRRFRNLWFYLALFQAVGVREPRDPGDSEEHDMEALVISHSGNSLAFKGLTSHEVFRERQRWHAAAERLALYTPSLAVSRTKRLDDELELSALLNLGSKRSSGNVVAVRLQQHALITALANRRLDSATIATLTGVKATSLLSILLLEANRLRACTKIINHSLSPSSPSSSPSPVPTSATLATLHTSRISGPLFPSHVPTATGTDLPGSLAGYSFEAHSGALTGAHTGAHTGGSFPGEHGEGPGSPVECLLAYLRAANPKPAVRQSLSAVVLRAWEAGFCDTGRGTPYPGLLCKDQRVAASRACSLLRGASDPDEFVRDMSLNMLSRLKATYPQVLWERAVVLGFSDLLNAAAERERLHGDCISLPSLPPTEGSTALTTTASATPLEAGPPGIPGNADGGPGAGSDSGLWLGDVRVQQAAADEALRGVARNWLGSARLVAPLSTEALLQESILTGEGRVGASSPASALLFTVASEAQAQGKGFPSPRGSKAAAAGTDTEFVSRMFTAASAKALSRGRVAGFAAAAEASSDLSEKGPGTPRSIQLQLLTWAAQGLERAGAGLTPASRRGAGATPQQIADACLTAAAAILHGPSGPSTGLGQGHEGQHYGVPWGQKLGAGGVAGGEEEEGSKERSNRDEEQKAEQRVLELLCGLPFETHTPCAAEAAVPAWSWLLAVRPDLAPAVLSHVFHGWAQLQRQRRGLFCSPQSGRQMGPREMLRPQLVAPAPPCVSIPSEVPGGSGLQAQESGSGSLGPAQECAVQTQGFLASGILIAWLADRLETLYPQARGGLSAAPALCSTQLQLVLLFLEKTFSPSTPFTQHPAARGPLFALFSLGLQFCRKQFSLLRPKEADKAQAPPALSPRPSHTARFNGHTDSHEPKLDVDSLAALARTQDLLDLCSNILRACFLWFAVPPEWFEYKNQGCISCWGWQAQGALRPGRPQVSLCSSGGAAVLSAERDVDATHQLLQDVGHTGDVPWDQGPAASRERVSPSSVQGRQFLETLLSHELHRCLTWAYPLRGYPDSLANAAQWTPASIYSHSWKAYTEIAWSLAPALAAALPLRFPGTEAVRSGVRELVQTHPLDLRHCPEVLPLLLEEDAPQEGGPERPPRRTEAQREEAVQQLLPYWDPCSIVTALSFLRPPYSSWGPLVAYLHSSLGACQPSHVTFFMPQLVQALRHDHPLAKEGTQEQGQGQEGVGNGVASQHGPVEEFLLRAAKRDIVFAHTLIWNLQGEEADPEAEGEAVDKKGKPIKRNALWDIVPRVREHIISSFSAEERAAFDVQFQFFNAVTSISGTLRPIPKEKRRAAIKPELEKIAVPPKEAGVYLPVDSAKLVRGIKTDSGIPLQSAAKVPIMITFYVVDRPPGQPYSPLPAPGTVPDTAPGTASGATAGGAGTGSEASGSVIRAPAGASRGLDGAYEEPEPVPQACIFKVGDDCRQDVLALQVISLLRDINTAVGLDLYLFPYGVLPTGYERGIIEVVPQTRSRNQMGEITDGGLYDIFRNEFGPEGSPGLESARLCFLKSCAAYAVASLILQPKDRHNGNLLIDRFGHLVHIDFGFILETSPGGNLRFESADFKLSHEMTQILDPSGAMRSQHWHLFVSLCVKGYLAARRHTEAICNTVMLMLESGLPCFSIGDPLGNLRRRFHEELSEREAADFMVGRCVDAYNHWRTAGYDLIQYLQQGILR